MLSKIVLGMEDGLTNDKLETMRTIARYLSQISLYKRELLINISTSLDNLEVTNLF